MNRKDATFICSKCTLEADWTVTSAYLRGVEDDVRDTVNDFGEITKIHGYESNLKKRSFWDPLKDLGHDVWDRVKEIPDKIKSEIKEKIDFFRGQVDRKRRAMYKLCAHGKNPDDVDHKLENFLEDIKELGESAWEDWKAIGQEARDDICKVVDDIALTAEDILLPKQDPFHLHIASKKLRGTSDSEIDLAPGLAASIPLGPGAGMPIFGVRQTVPYQQLVLTRFRYQSFWMLSSSYSHPYICWQT